MSAAVTSTDGQEDAIYDLMFPHDVGMTEREIREIANSGDKLHGSRADCRACHSKLDPMGQTLMTSQFILAPRASTGALSFPRSQQERVEIPVKGIGELAEAITRQPEYRDCQVQHFWNWFMDHRRVLTPQKKAFLAQQFDRVGRRVNDFVRVLIAQPEFYEISTPETAAQMRAHQVKRFFQRCQDCHRQQYVPELPDGEIPNFTQWPIGGSSKSMSDWIGRIRNQMDLSHDGDSPKMPPLEADWRTNFAQMELIKKWIEDGAPNEQGERMLKP